MTSLAATPPSAPFGYAPMRRPHSIRRTSSLDMTWPMGRMQHMQIEGWARDVYTPENASEIQLLTQDHLLASMRGRQIESIVTQPVRSGSTKLLGERGGGYLRQALNQALPQERDAGSPLYLLIDDLSGASLVSGWAWTGWQGLEEEHKNTKNLTGLNQRMKLISSMTNVCTGFQLGFSALRDHDGSLQNRQEVVELLNPADPMGWHAMPQQTGVAFRRARRIDVWLDKVICIDAMFQDSATTSQGGRCAVHEYTVSATVDPEQMILLSLDAQPRILPYRECPGAIENLSRLIGVPMRQLRRVVLERLGREKGCTHLNDALRSLAETPILAQHLMHLSPTN